MDLGEDISTCAGSLTLNADISNTLASYAWYRNNTLIPGENNSTLPVTQNGTYKVEVSVPVNGTNCVEEDEIVIILNTEESINPISDYELCESSGSNSFDLSTKNAELIPNIPFINYSYSYHYSGAESRTNSNPITTVIDNPPNPEEIFVRVQDLDSACFSYTTFNLIVNPLPNIVVPTTLEVCDGDDTPDGFAIIDLTVKDDEITSGQTNLFVTYHYNPLDASTGNNPIPTPYINTNTPSELVYVRVVDPNGKVLTKGRGEEFEFEGGSMTYSVSQEVEYANEQIEDLCLYYLAPATKFEKGKHTVEIYIDKALIGTAAVSLR